MRIELENALTEKYAFMKKGRSLDDQNETGCDSAVYKAAGYDELLAYRKEKIGFGYPKEEGMRIAAHIINNF